MVPCLIIGISLGAAGSCFAYGERDRWILRSFVDPLPNELVRGIAETSSNTLWFATWGGGLVRYNGTEFTIYGMEDGLHGLFLRDVASDSSGNLWLIGRKGLIRYADDMFRSFGLGDGLPTENLYSLHVDSKDRVWVGGDMGCLAVAHDGKITAIPPPEGLEDRRIRSIAYDEVRNILWAGWDNGYIRALNPDSLDAIPEVPDYLVPDNRLVKSLAVDSTGDLWAITEGGAILGRREKWVTIPNPIGSAEWMPARLCPTPDGSIWVGCAKGGVALLTEGHWTFFEKRDGLCNEVVYALHLARNGSLWVGTQGGITCLIPSGFKTIRELPSPACHFMEVHIDSKERLWVAGEELAYLEDGEWTTVGPAPEREIFVDALLETRDGRIIAAWNHRGILEWEDGETRWLPSPIDLEHRYHCMAELGDGRLLLGTAGDGLFVWDGTGWNQMVEAASFYNGRIFSLYLRDDGSIWIGGEGRLYVHRRGQLEEIKTPFSGSDSYIWGICEDNQGSVWLATYGSGIARYEDEGWTVYNKENSLLPTNRFVSLHRDDQGRIWAGAAALGVCRFEAGGWFVHSEECGLPRCRVSSIATSREGKIYFSTFEVGLLEYTPDTEPPETRMGKFPMHVVVDEVFNTKVQVSDPWNRTPPGRHGISWRIDDNPWVPVYPFTLIHASVSKPGWHTFQAKGYDIDGNTSRKVAELEFYASYEWWRHPITHLMGGFIVVNMVVIAVLVVLRFKGLRQNLRETRDREENLEKEVTKRTRALRESEAKYRSLASELEEASRFKDQLMTNVSHDFRTPLTSLVGYAELLSSRGPGPLTPQQEDFLDTILDNATRMETLLQNVTQIISDGRGDGQLVREPLDLQEVLWNSVKSHAFRAHDRNIEIEILPEGEDFWIAGAKDLVGRLTDNLISNAVKFSEKGGKVVIRLTNEEAAVVFSITDEGIGIDPDEIDRIFDRYYRADHGQRDYAGGLGIGLSICKEIADYHHATIEVESEPGKGSTFRVIWPDHKA